MAAERRARDNEWCPCGDHSGAHGLSAEDAIIVENESTLGPPRRGHPAAPAPSQAQGRAAEGRDGAERGGGAAAPEDILDLTLSDGDDVQDGAGPGASHAPGGGSMMGVDLGRAAGRADPGAGAGAALTAQGAGGAMPPEHALKRQRSDVQPSVAAASGTAAASREYKGKGPVAALVQLHAYSPGGTGASLKVLSVTCCLSVVPADVHVFW